jgi:hypothetical protein
VVELRHNSSPGARLLAAWSTDGVTWRSSGELPVAAGGRVASVGPAGGKGVFALLAGAKGNETLAEAEPERVRWQKLQAPPKGTKTVVFSSTGAAKALSVDKSVLEVWALDSASVWHKAQALHVQIEYGSSG